MASSLLAVLLLAPGAAALAGAPRAVVGQRAEQCGPAGARTDRRGALLSVGAGALAMLCGPLPSEASYAMYSASQASFEERKATGFVPVATSDRGSLAEIQQEISFKRPQSAMKVKKAPQYCAGQMASVQPMMENICSNIGLSKADQSNTRADSFGNMNVGQFTLEELEAREAARNARLRGGR